MPQFHALFIDGTLGRLFTVHHRPAVNAVHRCVVIVPAFAEEMNKSRRQIALLARALCKANVAVIIPDLGGTGDSDGRLEDCTPATWCQDLDAVLAYARQQGYSSVSLLGLRTGALLSSLYSSISTSAATRLLWWQPATAGKLIINQFLRLKMAANLHSNDPASSVASLRQRLSDGQSVEVAGYRLTPALVHGFDALDLAGARSEQPIEWFGIGAKPGAQPPAIARAVAAVTAAGNRVHYHACDGEPFWATAEIATAPALIDATVALLATSE